MTATEGRTLLAVYLEMHNNEISEPEFTDWLTTAMSREQCAAVLETLLRACGTIQREGLLTPGAGRGVIRSEKSQSSVRDVHSPHSECMDELTTNCDHCNHSIQITVERRANEDGPATFVSCPHCGKMNQVPPGKIVSVQKAKDE